MNPWIILAVVVAFGVTNFGSFRYGQHVQEAEDKAARLEAVTQAVEDANRVAEADKRKAIAAAQRKVKAQVRTVTIRGAAIETIREVPSPASCDWNSDSWRVLNDAISASNDQPPAASILPQPLPRAGSPGKPER